MAEKFNLQDIVRDEKLTPEEIEKLSVILETKGKLDSLGTDLVKTIGNIRIKGSGGEKYIKDAVLYNLDIKEIMKDSNSMKVMQLFLKVSGVYNGKITGVYDSETKKSIEEYRKSPNVKQDRKLNYLRKKFPQFNKLMIKYPERQEEWEDRMTLFAALEKAKGNFGFLINSGGAYEEMQDNIKELQTSLYTITNNSEFNSKMIKTRFEGWDNGFGSNVNVNWTAGLFGREELTYAELLARITNRSDLTFKLFGEKTSEKIEISEENKKQIERLRNFLSSFEGYNNQEKYKRPIKLAYSYLGKGDIVNALNSLQDINNDFDISISNIVSSQDGLMQGLRLIGDTTVATKVAINELKDSTIDTSQMRGLKAWIDAQRDNFELKAKKGADEKYNEVLKSLEGEPQYYDMLNNRAENLKEFTSLIALENLIGKYMEMNGDKGLGEIGKLYNDMKGISLFKDGLVNMSDEKAKITKEMAIIIASMVITAGASSAFSAIAGGARAIQVGRTLKTADNIRKGQNIRQAGNIALAGGARGVAGTTESLAFLLEGIKKVHVVGDAIIFTTAEGLGHELLRNPGEKKQDWQDFGNKLVSNTAMFGAFAGMGKAINRLAFKLGFNSEIATAMQKNAKFLGDFSGDMIAMYALHKIQTGKWEMSDEELATMAAQVIGFRGGMEIMSKMYPSGKLTQVMEQRIKLNREKVDGAKAEVARAKSGKPESEATTQVVEEGSVIRANPNRGAKSGTPEPEVTPPIVEEGSVIRANPNRGVRPSTEPVVEAKSGKPESEGNTQVVEEGYVLIQNKNRGSVINKEGIFQEHGNNTVEGGGRTVEEIMNNPLLGDRIELDKTVWMYEGEGRWSNGRSGITHESVLRRGENVQVFRERTIEEIMNNPLLGDRIELDKTVWMYEGEGRWSNGRSGITHESVLRRSENAKVLGMTRVIGSGPKPTETTIEPSRVAQPGDKDFVGPIKSEGGIRVDDGAEIQYPSARSDMEKLLLPKEGDIIILGGIPHEYVGAGRFRNLGLGGERFVSEGEVYREALNRKIKERSDILNRGPNKPETIEKVEQEINELYKKAIEKKGRIKIEERKFETEEEALSWFNRNKKRLAMGALGAIALLTIGGLVYLATMDENDEAKLTPVPTQPDNGEANEKNGDQESTPEISTEQQTAEPAKSAQPETKPAQPTGPGTAPAQPTGPQEGNDELNGLIKEGNERALEMMERWDEKPVQPEVMTENPTYTEEDYNKLKAFIENRSGFVKDTIKDSLVDKIVGSTLLDGYKHFGYNQDGTLYLKNEKSPYDELMVKFDFDSSSKNINYSISKETGKDIMDNPQYESKGKGKVKLSVNGGKVDKVELLK